MNVFFVKKTKKCVEELQLQLSELNRIKENLKDDL